MTFTDEDIKNLHELIKSMERLDPHGYIAQRLPDLITRLEASERLHELERGTKEYRDAFDVWWRSKGVEPK